MEVVKSGVTLCGKSRSLHEFQARLRHALVPEFLVIPLEHWGRCRPSVMRNCQQHFGAASLAVRSDAGAEDRPTASLAGKFLSLLDVAPGRLEEAIAAVANTLPGAPGDQIMVQRMVTGVRLAGVAATHRLHDGAPWYCIELAAGDSAAVTAGRASGRQHAVARAFADDASVLRQLQAPVRKVLDLLRETEMLCGGQPLEIEFAIGPPPLGGPGDQIYLLQVRPIVCAVWPSRRVPATMPPLGFLLKPDPCPSVAGPQTVLSLMADWNPAELLGAHPRPLALSLFQHLIADGIWWQARADLGYAKTPEPGVTLLHPVLGRPMVDVRRSANSLLPRGLAPDLASRVVGHWIDTLKARPELHDKVEFEVYRTVRDMRNHEELARRWSDVLGRRGWQSWESSLGQLAKDLTQTGPASALERHLTPLRGLAAPPASGLGWQALLERARRGAFAFSALARLAFVGEAQLRSVIERGALSPDRALQLRALSRQNFMPVSPAGEPQRTDLLRPSSFDITRPLWSTARSALQTRARSDHGTFQFDGRERRLLARLLREAELPITADEWLRFVQASASAREWGKQVFTADLCLALEQMVGQIEGCGLDREHASWLSLEQFRSGVCMPRDRAQRFWLRSATAARVEHAAQSQQILSPVLRGPQDRHLADSLSTLPNFVGRHVARGHLVLEPSMNDPDHGFQQAIVVLEQADPGYDWLFEHPIAGLITAWGGANSHMAIRCAEQGVAAAFGCGELLLARARKATHATIDPSGGGLWLN